MSRTDGSFNRFIRRGYPLIFAFVFVFHIGFSALPAVLMKNGRTGAGTLIYKYYSVLCHQLPQRSFFLFGEQPWYPLSVPKDSRMLSFEEAAGFSPGFSSGRAFYGTPEMGYKMAICQRDVAIYGSMALFCLLFALTGRRISRPRWILPLFFRLSARPYRNTAIFSACTALSLMK